MVDGSEMFHKKCAPNASVLPCASGLSDVPPSLPGSSGSSATAPGLIDVPPFLPGSSDHTTPPHGPVTSASVLSNAGLQSQKEIIEAIGQLTAEVRNFTNVLTDICCAIKDQKKYILCLVHERCITCPHNTTALGACSSFTACASISSGSDLGAGAAIPFLCAMLCKTRPNNMANLFRFI